MLTRRFNLGMTLIEILVALSIFSVLLVVGVNNLQSWVQNMQIRTVADAQVAGLTFARNEAIKRNEPVQITFNADYLGWSIQPLSMTAPVRRENGLANYSNVSVAATPVGALQITFNGLGRIAASNQATITQLDVDNTRLDASESQELRLLISPQGGVRLCRPGKVAPDPSAC